VQHTQPASARVSPGNVEQCRFSDPRLAADHQRRPTIADAVNQPIDKGDRVLAPMGDK
jgi:hypothetical protein